VAFFLQPEGDEVCVVGEREAFAIQSEAAAECGQRPAEDVIPSRDFSAARQRATAGQRAEPVADRRYRVFDTVVVSPDVLTGDVRQVFLVAVAVPVQYQAGLVSLVT